MAYVDSNGILSFEVRIPLDLKPYFSGSESFGGLDQIQIGLGSTAFGQSEGGRMNPGGEMQRGRRGGMMPRRSSGNDTDLWVNVVLAKST